MSENVRNVLTRCETPSCAICRDICKSECEDAYSVVTNCNHIFCKVCIDWWYMQNDEQGCPCCKIRLKYCDRLIF